MWKSCSRCGKIHDTRFRCSKGIIYEGGEERKMRSSQKWTDKSLEIRERANWLCEVCRDQKEYNYKDLEVHHIEKITERPDLLLDNSNLICLCKFHHKQAEKGILAKEYLRELAERRENT